MLIREGARQVAALLSILLLVASSIAQAEVVQASFSGDFKFRSVYFLSYATAVLSLPIIPAACAAEYAWRRFVSGTARSWRDHADAYLLPLLRANPRFSFRHYARAALPLNALTFLSFYLFSLALRYAPVSVVSPVFRASTVLIVLPLSVVVLREPLRASRLVAAALCVAGVAMSGYGNYRWPSDADAARAGHSGAARGYALLAAGAALWASHEILFQRLVGRANMHGVALLTFCGQAWAASLYWIGWVAVTLSGLEPWPNLGDSRVIRLLLAYVGFSALPLHSIALALAGPLFVDLAGTSAIPLSGVADRLLHGASYAPLTVAGMVTVTAGIAVVSLAGYCEVDGGGGGGGGGSKVVPERDVGEGSAYTRMEDAVEAVPPPHQARESDALIRP